MSGYLGGDHASINAQCIVDDQIAMIQSRISLLPSLQYCIDCGEEIPKDRRLVMSGIKRCIPCQQIEDKIKIRLVYVKKML